MKETVPNDRVNRIAQILTDLKTSLHALVPVERKV